MQLLPATVLNVALVGMTLYFALHNAALAFGPRGRAEHGWIGFFGSCALLVIGGRIVHYQAIDSATARLGLQLATTGGIAISPILVRACQLLVEAPSPRGLMPGLWALAALQTGLLWGSELIFSADARPWIDGLGQRYLWVEPGPAVLLLFVQVPPLLLYCAAMMQRRPMREPWLRWTITGGLVMYALGALNDMLVAAKTLHGVVVFEFAFIGLLAVFDAVLVGRFHKLHADLGAAVDERTRRLQRRNRELADIVDAAEAAVRAKSAFIRHLGHEFRSPLTTMIGYGELIADNAAERGDEPLRDDAQEVVVAGRALAGLLERVLEIARADQGIVDEAPSRFDVRTHAEQAIARHQDGADKAGKPLVLRLKEDVGELVLPAGKVHRILDQLLENAVQHADPGEITVRAWREQASPSLDLPELACWSVADNGPGIAKELHAGLFVPFAATPEGDDVQDVGPKLGLPVAQSLARALGGRIEVESAAGRGRTMTLRLPVNPRPPVPGSPSLVGSTVGR